MNLKRQFNHEPQPNKKGGVLMKRAISLLGIVAMLMLVPVFAFAGDYHKGASLTCSQCHVMHFSQSHGYNADGSGIFTPLGGTGPHEYLLRNEVNDLCLACHDGGGFAPDVLGPNGDGFVRQAGALNRPSHGVGQAATGHTLDSTDPAPGSNPAWSDSTGLHCTNCHQPHGYNAGGNAWRNLAMDPGNYGFMGSFVSYNDTSAAKDLTRDIYQVANGGGAAVHYNVDNVFFNEPDPTASAYAHFCKGCHTDFHGAKGGAEVGGASGHEWLRHPNADADIGAVGGGHSSLGVFTAHTNRVKVMSATGVWDPPAADNTPSCMSCHKAHGNQNAFGLIFMSGTGTVDEEGDDGTAAKALCKQCHVQG
jgi:hypothetical protein